MRKKIIVLLFISIIFVDQFFKFFVFRLKNSPDIFIFPKVLKLTFYQNAGIAFGIPLNPWIVYFLIIIFGFFTLIIWREKINYSFIFIFGGALSNLLDRIRFGYVIDFIELIPLKGFFNLADCVILVGTLIIFLRIINERKIKVKF